MSRDTHAETFVDEYGEWLKAESAIRQIGEWHEVTFPFLDDSNDRICFYMRAQNGTTSFTDDGYTMAALTGSGVRLTDRRLERIAAIARRFGAVLELDGQITMKTEGSRPDAMNRFIQALCDIQSLNETSQRRTAEYFADDVATLLDARSVFYTRDIGVHGASGYEHSFDFLFQRSRNHPTRFCQTPNRLDRNMAERIVFAWTDTSKAKERDGAQLLVIGDDREIPLRDAPVQALESYGILVIPFSELAHRAESELAA